MKTKRSIFALLTFVSILSCQKELRNVPVSLIGAIEILSGTDSAVYLSCISTGNHQVSAFHYDSEKRLALIKDSVASKQFIYKNNGIIDKIILRNTKTGDAEELVYYYDENSKTVVSIERFKLSASGIEIHVSSIKIVSDILGRKIIEIENFVGSTFNRSWKYDYDLEGNTLIYTQFENGREIRKTYNEFDNHPSALRQFPQIGLLPGECACVNNPTNSIVDNANNSNDLVFSYDIHYSLNGYPAITYCDANGVCSKSTFAYTAMK